MDTFAHLKLPALKESYIHYIDVFNLDARLMP